jgi:hypothetical protein
MSQLGQRAPLHAENLVVRQPCSAGLVEIARQRITGSYSRAANRHAIMSSVGQPVVRQNSQLRTPIEDRHSPWALV